MAHKVVVAKNTGETGLDIMVTLPNLDGFLDGRKIDLDDDIPEEFYAYRVLPNTVYCNSGEGFKTDTKHKSIVWSILGSCDCSMAPTSATITYKGAHTKVALTANTLPALAPPAHSRTPVRSQPIPQL